MLKPFLLNRQLFNLLTLLCLSMVLTACGFQLRGTIGYPMKTAYLQSENANRITTEVTRLLQDNGVTVTNKSEDAEIIVILRNEIIDRRVLSVSAITGRLEEIELNFRVELEVQNAKDKRVLQDKQVVSLLRDYSFDETAVLAKDTEEQVIKEDMFRDATAQVLRRLQMLKMPKSS
ncbi:Rare lipoprotein B [Beggiatoa alba B18LD]|uniref:LPS-assembly lipoprotein LptE n=1 Tax=Beggiatoa alba B18LD TaxID=395493 RepID=I3CL71_9GAMM|nr:LPS assembly lipoprotein LptE [Beggiatoa alba]EIJ44364.1 Rare lipoprotein B [Beggiatoa alba B18LD]